MAASAASSGSKPGGFGPTLHFSRLDEGGLAPDNSDKYAALRAPSAVQSVAVGHWFPETVELSRALKENDSLTSLTINHDDDYATGMDPVIAALKSSAPLRSVSLCKTLVSNRCFERLGQALASDTTLRSLSLCSVREEGGHRGQDGHVGRALETNTTLRHLHIFGSSGMVNADVDMLARGIRRNSTLSSLGMILQSEEEGVSIAEAVGENRGLAGLSLEFRLPGDVRPAGEGIKDAFEAAMLASLERNITLCQLRIQWPYWMRDGNTDPRILARVRQNDHLKLLRSRLARWALAAKPGDVRSAKRQRPADEEAEEEGSRASR